VIDERTGVRVAIELGFRVTGTLGVLVESAKSGLIPIEEALARLANTNFRRTEDLFARTRELVRQSRKDVGE
jgi:predicted nucleic acid-binding protein